MADESYLARCQALNKHFTAYLYQSYNSEANLKHAYMRIVLIGGFNDLAMGFQYDVNRKICGLSVSQFQG